MVRIGVDLHLLVEHELADAAAAALFREALRPSSVWRASAANIMNESRSATAAGSRTTVYFPGSMLTGDFDRAAFSMAAAASFAGSSRRSSLADAEAQPEPVPSGVRAVRLYPAEVKRS